jgi:hypothetical protein
MSGSAPEQDRPGKLELWPRPTEVELAQWRELAARGALYSTVVGKFSDGAIALVDLRADRDLLASPAPAT